MAYLNDEAVWAEGVRRLEETDDCEAGVFNEPFGQLTRRTSALKRMAEVETEEREALAAEVDNAVSDIETLAGDVESLKGVGGYLDARDFGSDEPAQEVLTAYACENIGIEDAAQIFNGTRIVNSFNNHVFVLANTPDTEPPVFWWSDKGQDSVAIATGSAAGVVRASEDIEVEPVTGKMRLSQAAKSILQAAGSGRNAPFLIAPDKRRLLLKAGVSLSAGGAMFTAGEDTELEVESLLDTGAALANGKDYYVFVCNEGGGEFAVKASLQKDAPDGYAPENAARVGGFHTLCANAGTGLAYVFGGEEKAHPLDGYMAGDILPASVWCLNHRPHSEPEGMVYIDTLDFWCDIYMQSGSGANTKSAYQGAATVNRQYTDFVEDQFCVKKSLLNDEEFAAAMLGSNEKTAISGRSTAGGHSDSAGRRMISAYGVEEGCGWLWQWLATTAASGGSGWTTQSGNKGDFYGECYVLLAGGGWGDGAGCGSRARNANDSRANAKPKIFLALC
jgi:hypothetical protein